MRKGWSFGVAALLAACAGEPETGQRTQAVGPVSQGEAEPNAAFDSATPLALDASGAARVVGNVFGSGDVDVYSFAASAGDRFSAATMTAGNASGSVDSRLELLDSDGVTVLELDNDDGTFGTTASVIAGRFLPADGTYYVRVTHPLVTGQLRPYHLWARLQTDDPLPELEPNDAEPGQLLAPGSWVFGALASAADVDVYAVELQAGDSLFADLDLDPERDTIEWNGLLRLTAPGEPAMQANDNGAAAPDAEALFFTATAAGTYYLTVASSASAGTYGLSATVVPRADDGGCTTYSAADLPLAIPTDPGVVSSTLTIPDDVVIDDLEVQLTLDHTFIADLDITLTSPTGNTVALFTDVGTSTVGLGSRTLDITLADEAAMPISTAGITPILRGVSYMPELASRLEWFDGQPAAGTWTLTVYDDASGDGGSVTAWGLRVCPRGAVACPAGASEQALLTADFEADDGGFTHSGTADEWERGTPSLAPLTTCGGGAGCWATDLDGTYDVSSSQDLLSPTIDLSGVSGAVYARWKQAFQLEAAQFDRASVSIASAAAPATARTLWDHLGADMIITAGNPSTTLQSLAGWGTYVRDVSSFAGVADAQLRFHLDSDTTVQRRGMGIDDVDVFTCAFRCGDGVLYDAGLGGTEVCDDGNPHRRRRLRLQLHHHRLRQRRPHRRRGLRRRQPHRWRRLRFQLHHHRLRQRRPHRWRDLRRRQLHRRRRLRLQLHRHRLWQRRPHRRRDLRRRQLHRRRRLRLQLHRHRLRQRRPHRRRDLRRRQLHRRRRLRLQLHRHRLWQRRPHRWRDLRRQQLHRRRRLRERLHRHARPRLWRRHPRRRRGLRRRQHRRRRRLRERLHRHADHGDVWRRHPRRR
jgi:subtilisin-like proprotein convertase family protein